MRPPTPPSFSPTGPAQAQAHDDSSTPQSQTLPAGHQPHHTHYAFDSGQQTAQLATPGQGLPPYQAEYSHAGAWDDADQQDDSGSDYEYNNLDYDYYDGQDGDDGQDGVGSYSYAHQGGASQGHHDVDMTDCTPAHFVEYPAEPWYPVYHYPYYEAVAMDSHATALGLSDALFSSATGGHGDETAPSLPAVPDSNILLDYQLPPVASSGLQQQASSLSSSGTPLPALSLFMALNGVSADPTAAPPADEPGAIPADAEFESSFFDEPYPGVSLSNPNPNTLGPGNPGLADFLQHWEVSARRQYSLGSAGRHVGPAPSRSEIIQATVTEKPKVVEFSQLDGDRCDVQGLDWTRLGVSRRLARERRKATYHNYTNRRGTDIWLPQWDDVSLPSTESYFRFRRLVVKQKINLAHFQLRSVLACPSRNQALYPADHGVGHAIHRYNTVSGLTDVAMDLNDMASVQISTLDAAHGVLVVGTFNGEYCMRRLDVDGENDGGLRYHEGQITESQSVITNHLEVHETRLSSSPVVSFASNDASFRVMDVETETFLGATPYPFPLNCSAVSPDRRLRVMVGDCTKVLICNAETGRILQALDGHRDFGFACDWSDDGWTVATGFQDKTVRIWDARRWTDSRGVAAPVRTIRSEMAGARSLRFSPLGSGRNVLVAAEEADYVNIIDADTFARKQTFDIFGEIGGVAFANEGRDLNVLCCDRTRGGLLQLQRCGMGFSMDLGDGDAGEDGEAGEAEGSAWGRTRRTGRRDRDWLVDRDRGERGRGPSDVYRRRAELCDELEPF